MVDLADVLRGVYQLEADPLAVPAGREPPALDHSDLVRHVGVLRVVSDAVDPRLRDDLSRFELLVHEATPVVRTSSWERGHARQCSAPTGSVQTLDARRDVGCDSQI